MKESLLTKFLKFSYGSWVGILLGVLNTIIITRILPPDALGKASMFELIMQVGMVLALFGADQAFVRLFYEEEESKRGALLFNCLRIPMFTSLLTIGIVFIFYQPISVFLFGKESLPLIVVFSVGIIAQLLLRFGQLVLRMQQKGNLYSLIQIFQKIFNIIFIVILFLLIGSTFEVIVFAKVATLILIIGVAFYYGKELWTFSNLKIKNFKHSQKEIFKLGAPFVLTIFISWLFESIDKIALRQWSTFDELGFYSAAMRLVALVMALGTAFSTFWTPVAYERFEHKSGNKDFFKYISIIVSFGMFFVAVISIMAKDLIVVLLGSDYRVAATIMPFLVFMPILYTISETTVIGINFYKKVNWHILIAGISCGVNILGNWLLVPSFGAIGASIATAFSYVVFLTLRTFISLIYFKVRYPLIRIYSMIVIISIYATISIISESIWINILLGFISLVALILLFYKDLFYILKNRKTLLD